MRVGLAFGRTYARLCKNIRAREHIVSRAGVPEFTTAHTHGDRMISEAVATIVTGVWALVFGVSFLTYGSALAYYNERRWPRFTSLLADNTWVTGIMTLWYGYQYYDGNTDYRWIAYALTCPLLVRSLHTYATCPAKRCLNGGAEAGRWALWGAMAATAVTMLTGFAITQVVGATARWVLFAGGFLFFGVAIALLYRAIEYRPAELPAGRSYWALVLIGAAWLAFPVLFALGPVLAAVISFYDVIFGYAMADLVAKVFAAVVLPYLVRLQCGRCVPRAPRCKPHRESACMKPSCRQPAHANAHRTPALCNVHGLPNCPICPQPADYAREAALAEYDDYAEHPFYLAHGSTTTSTSNTTTQHHHAHPHHAHRSYAGVQPVVYVTQAAPGVGEAVSNAAPQPSPSAMKEFWDSKTKNKSVSNV